MGASAEADCYARLVSRYRAGVDLEEVDPRVAKRETLEELGGVPTWPR